MSNYINDDNDEIFWNAYLQFPMDDLINNMDVLEIESDKDMQIDSSKSIENYLNRDLFPILESPDECEVETNTDTIIKTSVTIDHGLPQFIFAIDNIPPFYFLLQAEKPRNLEPIS